MEPQNVSEGDSASFTCELSKPAKSVLWMKDGKKIENDENFEITSSGAKYTLSLLKTSVDDSGDYTMSIGEKQTSAKLVVNGKHESLLLADPMGTPGTHPPPGQFFFIFLQFLWEIG